MVSLSVLNLDTSETSSCAWKELGGGSLEVLGVGSLLVAGDGIGDADMGLKKFMMLDCVAAYLH